MTIRWGVSPIAWANDDMPELGGDITLDTLLNEVRQIGFEGVELGCKFPRDAATLQPIMVSHGLKIIGGWYSTNLLVRDADAEIEAMADHVALLEAMGSQVFIAAETSNAIHCDRSRPLDAHPRIDDQAWEQFGARLNAVAAYVNERGLRFAYHHHLGTVVETGDELRRFFEVTGDHVGLTLDTGHSLCGGIDPLKVISERPERVSHVHCKDVRRNRYNRLRAGGASFLDGVVSGMFTAPGDGIYDYEPFLGALASVGYDGWIVIEAEQDPALANPYTYQQLGLRTLQNIAAEVGLAA